MPREKLYYNPIDENKRAYLKAIDEKAAFIRSAVQPRLTQLVITSDYDTVKSLLYQSSQFTITEVHILLSCITPTSFYTLCNNLVEKKAPITEPNSLCEIVAKLAARKYVTLTESQLEQQKTNSYQGTLTVHTDGTITFVPDEDLYKEVFGNIPLVTIETNLRNIPSFKPIYIKGLGNYLAREQGKD